MSEHKHLYKVSTEHGELLADISGKMRHDGRVRLKRDIFPAIGDWVVLKERPGEQKAVIQEILPRKSKFSRKVAGTAAFEQIIAANVDTVFVLSSLNREFNLSRIQRYLVFVWESGAKPVIVLTKADLIPDFPEILMKVASVAKGVPIHVISSVKQEGLEQLSGYFKQGETVALLGSSGVGKSTLTNCLLGESVKTVHETRESDDRGRHTTTHRELHILPSGGLIMDSPGIRELQIWEADKGLERTYSDIEEFAEQCKFHDCLHRNEPGCAVKQAVHAGSLSYERFESYKKMQLEYAAFSLRKSGHLESLAKAKGSKYAMILQSEKNKSRRRKR